MDEGEKDREKPCRRWLYRWSLEAFGACYLLRFLRARERDPSSPAAVALVFLPSGSLPSLLSDISLSRAFPVLSITPYSYIHTHIQIYMYISSHINLSHFNTLPLAGLILAVVAPKWVCQQCVGGSLEPRDSRKDVCASRDSCRASRGNCTRFIFSLLRFHYFNKQSVCFLNVLT